MKICRLPDLGEGLQDAEIVTWHVSPGDRVVADQPLVSVETEKAVVEIPSPWSGTIISVHGVPHDIVKIGAPLAEFDVDASAEDKGTVVGELPAASCPVGAVKLKTQQGADSVSTPVRAAPAVRAYATELGLDLATITGTGPDGAISRGDVEAAAGGDGFEPLRGVRRSMARNMAAAHAEIAATTVTEEANISHWAEEEDVTWRLIRAMAVASKKEPSLNAWFNAKRQARRLHPSIDIGIAMNTQDGLFVPVLRDAGTREEGELRAALETMKKDVASRSVPPEALQGQTITLSNFGMIGGRYATLIIVPPQVAILGAGRITGEPCVQNGEVRVCKVLPLSLTFDHRAVTGAEATRFLMAVLDDLQT